MRPACKGVTQLIATANSTAPGGQDNPQSVDQQGNRNLIETACQDYLAQFLYPTFDTKILGISAQGLHLEAQYLQHSY